MQQGNSPRKWNMADRVEAFHKKFNAFRPGKIVAVHKSTGLFDVSFNDGGESLDISPDLIRGVGSSSQKNSPVKLDEKPVTAYKIGDQVEANREGKDIWRYAVIAKVYPDQCYDVVYTDRFRENHISPELVRGLYDSADQFAPAITNHNLDIFADPSGGSDDTTMDDVCLGMIVEARYHGGKQYFPGTITRLSKHSNTVDILYEDGDAETFLPIEYVRLIPGKSIMTHNRNDEPSEPIKPTHVMSNEDPMFTVGLAVEGNFQGKNHWYPGIVTRVRALEGGEFRYAVRYSDGDSEENVPEHMLRMPKLRSIQKLHDTTSETASNSVTQPVRPTTNNENNATSPNFPETGSPLKARRVKQTADILGRSPQLVANDQQQQSLLQKKNHHRHHNNSKKPTTAIPDVQYINRDDHSLDEQSQNIHAALHDDDRPEPILSTKLAGDLHVGTVSGSTPTAKAKKHHKHQKSGKDQQQTSQTPALQSVSSANNAAPHIRPQRTQQPQCTDTSPITPGRMPPQELDADESNNMSNTKKNSKSNTGPSNGIPLSSIHIEANFRGNGVWFPGRLLRERENGTVDVLYDDGDQELGVPITHIRPMYSTPDAVSLVPTASSAVPQKAINISKNIMNKVNESPVVGDAEKIENRESNYHKHHHRNKAPSVGEFSVGDRVVANYRNQGQLYPGIVKRLHSHGLTVDIVYDDDDLEKKVPIDRVQKLDAVTFLASSMNNSANNTNYKQSRPTTTSDSATQQSKPSQQRPLVSPPPSSSAAPPIATVIFPDSEALGLQLQQQLALNSNDIAALREYIRRKDTEIERLRQTISQLTIASSNASVGNTNATAPDGRRTAPSGANRPGRQFLANNNNNISNSNTNHKEVEDERTPHAPVSMPRPSRSYQNIQNNNGTSNNNNNNIQQVPAEVDPYMQQQQQAMIQQLIRANEELKRSVAFLGQKFTMVVEELARVKNHEEKLAKHVKKHGEVLKRLYQQDRRLHGHHHSRNNNNNNNSDVDDEDGDDDHGLHHE